MKSLIFASFILLLCLIRAIHLLIIYKINMRKYGKQLRHLYEHSLYENDLEVRKRALEHEKWLERSGNESGVKVRIILYRDKVNPLETWEEFKERLHAEMKADMILRDEAIEAMKNTKEKRTGREFYLEEVHGQYADQEPDFIDHINNFKSRINGIRISAQKLSAYARYLREFLGRSL